MKAKRTLALLLCMVMLVAGSVLGTVAYLPDDDAAVNTFTVGKVYITLDEKDVDDSTPNADRDTANKYHLLPGQTYVKDPVIHVDAESDACYLFVKVENGIADIETKDTSKTIAAQMAAKGWKSVDGDENLYIFAKGDNVDKYELYAGANVEVFDSFTVDGDSVDNEMLDKYEGKNITVTAYAVQKAGFENSAPIDIWNATFGATP